MARVASGRGRRAVADAIPVYALDVLTAVDVNLGAVEVRRGIGTQHVNDLGDFIRRTEAMHRNMFDDLLGSRRQHRRVDFARRDGVDAYADCAEIRGHFPRQRRESRL